MRNRGKEAKPRGVGFVANRGGEGLAEAEVVVREPSPLARFMLELDEQWPILRFLGFGFYYAWIWLSYNSSILVGDPTGGGQGADSVFAMYLASTTALALMLILAAVFTRVSARVVESRPAVFALSLVAAVSTVGVRLGSAGGASDPLFLVSSVLTGVGTAWVALRLGAVYSAVSARRASLYTAASICCACLFYFLAVGLPHEAGLLATALLPVLAAVCTMTTSEEPVVQSEHPQRAQALPKWFFFRLVVAIGVFSTAVGVTRGFSTLTQSAVTLDEQGVLIVFATGLIALVLYVLVSFLGNDFDISRLYYPAIILVVAGISIMPLLGTGVFENHFINIAYVCFIMVVWCLCAHVSNKSGLSPVRVFGLGRGASALGTTLGWLCGSQLIAQQAANPSIVVIVSGCMVFALLVVSMLVFNDRLIGSVLRGADKGSDQGADGPHGEAGAEEGSTFMAAAGGAAAFAGAPDAGADAVVGHRGPDAGEPTEDEAAHRTGAFTKRCLRVAEAYGLSQRERDVLFLLAKGRTISYIADELSVSFNTAKSHIRHVYVKTGVHTRQELLSLIEGIELG